ncbi:MAG: diaminobutyrate acetyltransferase [Porticoccaceae bacterium]
MEPDSASDQETRRRADRDIALTLREPHPDDGPGVFDLIARCPPLDPNSRYCNLLQCSHFAATSIIATADAGADAGGHAVVGFISGYRMPARPDTLFVWQVAVDAAARGLGLGSRLLTGLLARPALADIRFLETTIGPDNRASWALFERLAERLSAAVATTTLFASQRHFGGRHPDEILCRIGPFDSAAVGAARCA